MQPSALALGTPQVPVLSVQPRYLPTPDRLETSLPEGHIWLVVEQVAGDVAVSELIAALEKQGDQITRLAFGQAPLAQQGEQVDAAIGGVIAVSNAQADDEANLAWVREIFTLAGTMQPRLTQSATADPDARVVWLTVSRGDGMLAFSGMASSPVQVGGLAGLSKSLRLEWPDVYCRHLDVGADMTPENTSQIIITELFDNNLVLTETAWGSNGRMTLETALPQASIDQVKPVPDAETVFLVSGGGRGITAECVTALAKRYHSKFILVGRSALSDDAEPGWAAGIDDGTALKRAAASVLRDAGDKPNPRKVTALLKPLLAQREIRETLQKVTSAGGQAVYVAADVLDEHSLRDAIHQGETAFGPVTAILHGAGVLADKFIQDKTPEDFDRVVGVKIKGVQNMLACVDATHLQQLVLFSSVAGFYGNMGQADYALANDILNKLAYQWAKNHPSCRVLTMDWGPWDGGMVTPALKRLLAARNIGVIPVPDGTQILANALAHSNAVQYVIGSELQPPAAVLGENQQTFRTHRKLRLDENPFLQDHVIGGNAVLPTVCAVAWMANAAMEHYPGYHYHSVSDYRVFKGVVFDSQSPLDFILDVSETQKVEGEKVVVDTLIWSKTATDKPRYHYRASITLVREFPEAPVIEHFTLAEEDAVDGHSLYDGETLFHGPSFRGIERILNRQGNRLTMRCRLPYVSVVSQGQFPVHDFNPFLVDVQLQSLLVWSKAVYGYAGLPLSIQSGVQYRNVGFGETSYVTLDVQNHTPRSLVANVTIHDEQGRICTQVINAEITLSERLNTLFAQNEIVMETVQ